MAELNLVLSSPSPISVTLITSLCLLFAASSMRRILRSDGKGPITLASILSHLEHLLSREFELWYQLSRQ